MRFNEIIGNKEAKELLIKTIKSKNLLNSYLFVGEEGIGKKEIAIEFARMILCEDDDFENDSSCSSCIKFDSNNHPDFSLIESESNIISVDDIREIVDDVYQKPINSSRKIIVIDNAEYMNESAQNAFLKTLEDPPSYVTIILITSREDMLLNTILSRCTKIQFNRLSESEIEEYVDRNNDKFDNKVKNLISYANGSVGKLYAIQDNADFIEEMNNIIDMLINKKYSSKIDFMKANEKLYASKDNIYDILDFIIMILFKELKNNYNLADKVTNIIKNVELAKTKLKANCNFEMTIDDVLFKMWEEINEEYSRR